MATPTPLVKRINDLIYSTFNQTEAARAGQELMRLMLLNFTQADEEYTLKMMNACIDSGWPEWKPQIAKLIIEAVHNRI